MADQQYFDQNALGNFFDFLRFPSIASDPPYKEQVRDCAEWLKDFISEMGMNVEIWETNGAPVVFASWNKAGDDKPTLLIYQHYDVQPVDPIELWTHPPFEPVLKDGQVYARGAQDNKGQCFSTLQALKILLSKDKNLPINIKLCIEGEEECGSAGLQTILKSKTEQLKADYLAVVDLGMLSPSQPAVTLGCRGIVTFDLEVVGPKGDLHSGSHGGVVQNPIQVLVEMLSKLHDPTTGRVTVPKFYDHVDELSEHELSKISFVHDELQYVQDYGIKPAGGEKGLHPLHRAWLRPTLEINGVAGGYFGAGFKTVIPSKAWAKLSCRLVANQNPDEIAQLVIDYVKSLAPEHVKVAIHRHPGGGVAVRTDPNSPIVQAFLQAYTEVFNTPAVTILEGGSIPITAQLKEACQGELVMVGLGLGTDAIHAPNEHYGIDRLEKGVQSMIKALTILGQKGKKHG